jgi:bifunctional DNA-binding transcriptional regulator/antitoxin component of YhaV-PrlF toxin-antitoxin module
MLILNCDEELEIINDSEGLTIILIRFDYQLREEFTESRKISYLELSKHKNNAIIETIIEELGSSIQVEIEKQWELETKR